jgi:GMP synthase-like glutamine amidotransferase
MGAEVETRAQYSEIGTMSYELTDDGLADPVFGTLPRRFDAQTGHTDAVTSIPSGITVMAQNDQLKSQAFKVDGCPFYSTQFHPDLTGFEAHSRYLALQAGLQDVCTQASLENVERYVVGKDDIEGLLAHFIEATVNGEAAF